MRTVKLIGLALGLSLLSTAQAATQRDFATLDKPGSTDTYPVQVTKWPGGVTSLADVTFSTIPGYRPMIVDIYMPPKKAGPKPLIMYVHGGGWVGGTTRNSGAHGNFPAALAKLASEGFVVASLEYRLAGEARFPAQVQDTRAALRFLKDNAARYGIDPKRTGIWGGSAGAHLAGLAAYSCGVEEMDRDHKPDGRECVQAFVGWYGVYDFGALAASRPERRDQAGERLLGCDGKCPTEAYLAASPAFYIDSKDPPTLLIHGTEDKVVPISQSYLVEKELKAAGVPVESLYIPAVDHSFIGKTPADTRAATLQATNATFDFFHAKLDKPAK